MMFLATFACAKNILAAEEKEGKTERGERQERVMVQIFLA